MHLLSHSAPPAVVSVEAAVSRSGSMLSFTYKLTGALTGVVIPPRAPPVRTDELWRTTCFEAFIGGEGTSYIELNFSPSCAWAAYAFDAYREGMRGLDLLEPPNIAFDGVQLAASVALPDLPGAPLALTAVLEHANATKSYWALAHVPGPPDFHNRDCFVARLP